MKKNLVLLALGALTFVSCQTQPKEDYSWIKKGLDAASAQLQLTAEEISSTNMLPRSIRTGYDMENAVCAAFMTGPAVSIRALCGMPTN